jgi:hypothetical protein
VWEPQLSPEGPVAILVSLPEQMTHVYRNGLEIGVTTVSTGRKGHRTPTGVFVILQKDKHHHSNIYNNASMPNSQRLTWGGVFLHAGGLPGYPSSHGCVHLPLEFSAKLFEITHLGTAVIIADDASAPADVVHPGIILNGDADQMIAQERARERKRSTRPCPPRPETTRIVCRLPRWWSAARIGNPTYLKTVKSLIRNRSPLQIPTNPWAPMSWC